MKREYSFTVKATGESFRVEIDFNLDEIARTLAARAIASKHGKAVCLNGDIVCRVTERNKQGV